MIYRLAEESDIDGICGLVKAAVHKMQENHNFQWDDFYPARENFLDDIEKKQLYVGVLENHIAIVYAVNKKSEDDYQNGNWEYTGGDFRVIHRLCVNPAFQHRGIAAETLDHVEEELRKSNVKAVRLDVYSLNSAAQSLYFGRGYKKVGFVEWEKGIYYLLEKLL